MLLSGPFAIIILIILVLSFIVGLIIGIASGDWYMFSVSGVLLVINFVINFIIQAVNKSKEKTGADVYVNDDELQKVEENEIENNNEDLGKLSENNTIYCPYCGKELPIEGKFCKSCGRKI